MSTTFSTPDYTLVGEAFGTSNTFERSVCCLLLNREGKYERETVIRELTEKGLSCIISVEQRENFFEAESLCETFPTLRFLLFDTVPAPGMIVNLVSEIAGSMYLAVIWNHMMTTRYAELGCLERCAQPSTCLLVPVFWDLQGEALPQLRIPSYEHRQLVVRADYFSAEYSHTLYAPHYVGIYKCSTFAELGGFDVNITHPFWQQVDFGLRMYRRGWEALVSDAWQVRYKEQVMPEDQSENVCALRCYLKNIMPVAKARRASLPISVFFNILFRWRLPFFTACSVYREALRWVQFASRQWKLSLSAVIRKFLKHI